MTNIYYLSHGGPGSGRYPLGSGDRPYQKFEGTGRKPRGIVGYIKEKKRKKAEEEERRVKLERARKRLAESERTRRLDDNKENVLRSGKASDVLVYQGRLTNDELNRAVRRLDLETKLKDYASKEKTTKIQKIDSTMKNIETFTDWGKTGINAYNTLATVYNATPNGQKKPWTLIGSGGGGGGKDNKGKGK